MFLGNTYEEKKASMEVLCKRAKTLGIVFALAGVVYSVLILVLALQVEVTEGSRFVFYLGILLSVLGGPIAMYIGGYTWYFGFITVNSWFVKNNVSAVDAAAAAGSTLAVSYLLGGKKGVKTSFIVMAIVVSIALTIGYWVGLCKYILIKIELRNCQRRKLSC